MTIEDTNHQDCCISMFEKLSEYIDNELDEITCRDIEQHAMECAKCSTCIETLKRTINLCRSLEERPTPEAFSLRLKDMVQKLSS